MNNVAAGSAFGRRPGGPHLADDRAAPAGSTSSLYELQTGRLIESFLVLNGILVNGSGGSSLKRPRVRAKT